MAHENRYPPGNRSNGGTAGLNADRAGTARAAPGPIANPAEPGVATQGGVMDDPAALPGRRTRSWLWIFPAGPALWRAASALFGLVRLVLQWRAGRRGTTMRGWRIAVGQPTAP